MSLNVIGNKFYVNEIQENYLKMDYYLSVKIPSNSLLMIILTDQCIYQSIHIQHLMQFVAYTFELSLYQI
jgi:hypothetical protein